ncbi:MAG: nuclear transport factor 2 family protein [Candidatus Xenobiia bacterium LiM19]
MSDAAFELEQVNEALKRYYIALSERDIELLSDVMAHDEDMVCFGTDSDERWTGWSELEEIYRKQFEAITKYEISRHEQVVKLNPSADTAWFSEILKAHVEAMDDIYELSLRISGVLEKREGKWVIVHFHRSLPKEGFAVKYMETHGVRF